VGVLPLQYIYDRAISREITRASGPTGSADFGTYQAEYSELGYG
jgi:hypothetical protein